PAASEWLRPERVEEWSWLRSRVRLDGSFGCSFRWRHKCNRRQDRPIHFLCLRDLEQQLLPRLLERWPLEDYGAVGRCTRRQTSCNQSIVLDGHGFGLYRLLVFLLGCPRELNLRRKQFNSAR